MAASKIAGFTGGVGIKLPCILYEGVPTVTTNTMGNDGYFDTGITYASPLAKDQWVQLDEQTENTYATCLGNPVVKALTASTPDAGVGKIVSEPTIQVVPPSTTAGNSWAKILAGKYYRVANVEFFGVTGVAKADMVTADAAAVVPCEVGKIQIDASATTALTTAGAPDTLSVMDVASGAVGMFSFHYVAKAAAATTSVLVGFTGGEVTIVA